MAAKAEVEYDAKTLAPEDIAKAISGIGFHASVLERQDAHARTLDLQVTN